MSLAQRVAAVVCGWLAALRGLPGNPLLQAWRLGERRHRRSRWAPLLTLALLAAGPLLLAYAGLNGYWNLGDAADFPVVVGVAALLPAALAWLLLRTYAAALLALGYLGRDGSSGLRHRVDDITAISTLSEQELVLAGLAHALRLVLPPALLLNALLVAAVGGLSYYIEHHGASLMYPDSRSAEMASFAEFLLAAPWLWLRLSCGSLLAALSGTLLLITLGSAARSGILPAVGAAVALLGQLGFFSATYLLQQQYGVNYVSYYALTLIDSERGLAVNTVLVYFGGFALLLYLARRLDWLRIALACLWPLLLLGAVAGLSALGPFEQAVGQNVLWCATGFSLVNSLLLDPARWLQDNSMYLFGRADLYSYSQGWRAAVLLTLQAGLVLLLAEFARDALARRKWGSLGDVYQR